MTQTDNKQTFLYNLAVQLGIHDNKTQEEWFSDEEDCSRLDTLCEEKYRSKYSLLCS